MDGSMQPDEPEWALQSLEQNMTQSADSQSILTVLEG